MSFIINGVQIRNLNEITIKSFTILLSRYHSLFRFYASNHPFKLVYIIIDNSGLEDIMRRIKLAHILLPGPAMRNGSIMKALLIKVGQLVFAYLVNLHHL